MKPPGTLVTLDGSGSRGPDPGDALQFRWTFTAFPGPTPPRLSNPRVPKPTFTPQLVGLYELTLTVKDGHGGKASDGVVVNVQEPIDQIAQPCNCQGQEGDVVELPVRVIDPNGNGVPRWPVTFTLVRGDGTFVALETAPLGGRVRRVEGKPGRVTVANRRHPMGSGIRNHQAWRQQGHPPAATTASGEAPATVTALTDGTGVATAFLRLGAEPFTVEARAQAVSGAPAIFELVGLISPEAIAIEGNGSFVVVDNFLSAVLRIDPISGNPTILSNPRIGRGPPLVGPSGIAVEADGSLMVVDGGLRAVLRVDPVTGDRTIISGCTEFDVNYLIGLCT